MAIFSRPLSALLYVDVTTRDRAQTSLSENVPWLGDTMNFMTLPGSFKTKKKDDVKRKTLKEVKLRLESIMPEMPRTLSYHLYSQTFFKCKKEKRTQKQVSTPFN